MDIQVTPAAIKYIGDKAADKSITVETFERPGGI